MVAAVAVLTSALCASAAPDVWDEPAIKDHPDHGTASIASLLASGRRLFSTRFNLQDGAGRPGATGDSKPTVRAVDQPGFSRTAGPDASSCAGCHNQPTIGGSGDFAVNVFVGAHFTDPLTTSTEPGVTNERNTNTVAGTGAIELVAREMTSDLRAARDEALARSKREGRNIDIALTTKGVEFGHITARPDGTYDTSKVEGIDADLVVKPFGRKGIIISLREFTVAALNQHHGIQAEERFGWEKTGQHDFDGDGVSAEFSVGQVTALVLFQATLPAPRNATSRERERAVARGRKLFGDAGCATCHRPTLASKTQLFTEPNPWNRPGTVLPTDVRSIAVPVAIGGTVRSSGSGLIVEGYTDLKRHRMCDAEVARLCNERLRQDNVPTDQFITPRLWDLATSAPFGHRGDITTLSEMILAHGGEARASRDAFLRLSDDMKRELLRFLGWLGSGDEPN